MTKILITGGAGYIGSHANLELLDNGFKTIVFDNLSKGSLELVPNNPNCEFIQGDLGNVSEIESVFANHPDIDGVMHFAASIEVGESVTHPDKYWRNNLISTFNLLNAMKSAGVKNIVFSSTAATYGNPTRIPINENDQQLPINPYGNSKLAMEKLIQDYVHAYGFHAMVFRYFNACGADEAQRSGYLYSPATHLIPIVCEAINGDREFLSVFGDDYATPDGTCIRDYIHVSDLGEVHRLGMELLLNQTESYYNHMNLGTGNGYSVKQIIEIAETTTGKPIPTRMEGRRAGDPDQLVADVNKVKEVLNWTASRSSLENIISTAWAWKQHKLN